MRWWWGVLMVVVIVGWRVMGWRQMETGLRRGETIKLKLMLTEPVRAREKSCNLWWRGWNLFGFQSICKNSNLIGMSAGDWLNLEVTYAPSEEWGEKQLQIRRVEKVSPRGWMESGLSEVVRWSERWRKRLMMNLKKMLPENEAALMAGILWGEKSQLSSQFTRALVHTGTMHVVAASGYNLTVVAGVAMQVLLRVMSRKKAAGVAIVVVWVYVVMAGWQPPIVRAGVTTTLMLFSWMVGKEVWVLFGYLVSGGVMVMAAPWLLESVSFQLSMAATAGVIWGREVIEQLTQGIGGRIKGKIIWEGVWENMVTTMAAMLITAPIILINFGQLSWWGLVINPLVLGMVPLLMYLGIAMVFLGNIWLLLGQIAAWLTVPVARLWIEIVMVGRNLPGGMMSLPMNWWMAWGWWWGWLGLAAWTLRLRKQE